MLVSVGSYHVPFLGYPILALGIYNHKFGYPKKGTWYEPTGIYLAMRLPQAAGGSGQQQLCRLLVDAEGACSRDILGGHQNDGRVLGNTRCRIILRNQKRTIILTTTHMSQGQNSLKGDCKRID